MGRHVHPAGALPANWGKHKAKQQGGGWNGSQEESFGVGEDSSVPGEVLIALHGATQFCSSK